ncbi:hypothetical protein EV421DRAFT_1899442 [Armillaria borealis]|uniref:Uncharacterized protein n=1 Tax=Armillaria borealis TaxID=47425 RepID=A0AA39MXQ6_9AGAR|nr:hypothetical protein EV421DRAFT_1899442 [Armillaria borealis]
MEILDKLENTLINFEPPPNLSPHALHDKYESIITVAKERLVKAEEDIPPPSNQLALWKKKPILISACENLTIAQQNKNVKEQLTLINC